MAAGGWPPAASGRAGRVGVGRGTRGRCIPREAVSRGLESTRCSHWGRQTRLAAISASLLGRGATAAGLEAASGPQGLQETAQGGECPHSRGNGGPGLDAGAAPRASRVGSSGSEVSSGHQEAGQTPLESTRTTLDHCACLCQRGSPPRREPATTLRGSELPAWGPGSQSVQGALLYIHSSSRHSQQTAGRATCPGLGAEENCPKLLMQEGGPESEPAATSSHQQDASWG